MSEETKHSPEPWMVAGDADENGGGIYDANAVLCAEGWGSNWEAGRPYSAALEAANARRIVACVNALAGIPTEALEAGKVRALLDAVAAWSDIQNLSIHDPAIKARVDALEFAWRALKETP